MEHENKLPDSGTRREFETGAVRDAETDKGRFDLLSPIALKRLAVHFERGARKYSERNWEKGIPLHSFFDSAIRHMYAYLGGDRSEDHLSAAMWNVHCLIHTEEMIKQGKLPETLNTLPKTNKKCIHVWENLGHDSSRFGFKLKCTLCSKIIYRDLKKSLFDEIHNASCIAGGGFHNFTPTQYDETNDVTIYTCSKCKSKVSRYGDFMP